MKLMKKLKKKPYNKYLINLNLKLKQQVLRLNQILKLRKNLLKQLKKNQQSKNNLKIYKLKQSAKCPDCNMDMTVHTIKYVHKRRGL